MNVEDAKQVVREWMWAMLDREGVVASAQTAGTVPGFLGSEQAALRLSELQIWESSEVIKINPDRAQLAVRTLATNADKVVYMAVSDITADRPFYHLDSSHLGGAALSSASTPVVGIDEMSPVDLVVCGAVAVNREGTRIGTGAGHSDLEFAVLAEAGLVGPDTAIVTTVHDLQIIDDALPETAHDFSVDLIVTPHEVIECWPPRRPSGIVWEHLSAEQIADITLLVARNRWRP